MKNEIFKSFKKRYMIALIAIAAIMTMSQSFIQYHFVDNDLNGEIINVAGRQRMLTQKISKQLILLMTENNVHKIKVIESLDGDMDVYTNSFDKLLPGGKLSSLNSSEVNFKYGVIIKRVEELKLYYECFKDLWCNLENDVEKIYDLSNLLTNEINEIVNHYENENKKSHANFSRLELFLYFVILFVLVLEALFIFKPLEEKLRDYFTISQRQHKVITENEGLVQIGKTNAYIVHEIKNLLNIIYGNAKILSKLSKKSDDELAQKRSDIIIKTSDRMILLLESTRKMSRKEHDEFELISSQEFMEHIKIYSEHLFRDSKVKLKLSNYCIKDMKMNVSQMTQVVINLINNSLDAISEQENPWVLFEISCDDHIHLKVTDSGKGIPKEHQTKMFDSFYTSKKDSMGTGIGLDVCKDIVEDKHGGTIKYNDDVENTQFEIVLKSA